MSLRNGFGCRNLFVVIHAEIQPQELDDLTRSAPAYVLARIATHNRTWRSTLTKLAHSVHADVRCAVGENPNTPRDVLMTLAADADVDVRYSLAENHNLPAAVLDVLMMDENPYVAARASRTLQRVGNNIAAFNRSEPAVACS
jgi:hypothetical protein